MPEQNQEKENVRIIPESEYIIYLLQQIDSKLNTILNPRKRG